MGEETAPAAVAGEAGEAGGAGGAGGGGDGGVDLADYRLKVGNVLEIKFAYKVKGQSGQQKKKVQK